jgi:two-component system LytT family sensor kinase
MRTKVLGISAPAHWKLKLFIFTTLAVVGIWVRYVLDFDFPPNLEGLLFVVSVMLLYGYYELFFQVDAYLNRALPYERGVILRISVQVAIGMIIFLGSRQLGLRFLAPQVGVELNKLHMFFLVMTDIFASMALNLGFISDFFIRRWKENMIKNERLQREKMLLKYQQLKNQVNPHLLFNALSSLDSLIQTDPPLASRFVRHMSKVYRYVLQHKEQEVVNLETELAFIQEYSELLKIRFGEALRIDVDISEACLERGIVMISLQTLIDNAIKHNEIHKDNPLRIRIYNQGSHLVIENNKQLRKSIHDSNNTGLSQLQALYQLLAQTPLEIEDTPEAFVVKLPMI